MKFWNKDLNGLQGFPTFLLFLFSMILNLLVCIPSYGADSILTMGFGIGRVLDDKQEGYGFIEYRIPYDFRDLQHWFTVEGTRNVLYIGTGILLDIHLTDHWIITPSFGAGYYDKSRKIDLGYSLEFRSAFEISYHFMNKKRVGISFGHYSNASFGEKNPGVESLKISYSIPF